MVRGAAAPTLAAALLTLTPASAPTIRSGQIQQLVLSAIDANGAVLPNLPVTFMVAGLNQQTQLLTTDGVGQTPFAYAGSPLLSGADTVQAVARINGVDQYSNTVVIPWNSGVASRRRSPIAQAAISRLT